MTTEWNFENNPINEIDQKFIGFIYCITQISTGKKYIGKKKAFFRKTSLKTIKLKSGEKRKKKVRSLVPSDWKSYYGSSNKLLEEIEKCGKEDFTRQILKFCQSETDLSYSEAKEQFDRDVLLKKDEYFNEWIMVRCRRDNLLK